MARSRAFAGLFLGCSLFAAVVGAVDLQKVEAAFASEGITGRVHGAYPEAGLFVFTYRDPGDFFDHYEFPLTTKDPAVRKQMRELNRHDKIWIRGEVIRNGAAISHLRLHALRLEEKYVEASKATPYKHKTSVPGDLLGKPSFVGRIHAVSPEGAVMVVEYGDVVLPVFVSDTKWTQGLYRNDKVRVRYKIRTAPLLPTHIELDTSAATPVEVLEHIVDLHGKPADLTGVLVMFPKSPQVIFNVFALQTKDADGVEREHTLLNADSAVLFEAIRAKAEEFWGAGLTTVVVGRNKLLNPAICVRAVGKFNVVDPSQANPQIYLGGPEDLTQVGCR